MLDGWSTTLVLKLLEQLFDWKDMKFSVDIKVQSYFPTDFDLTHFFQQKTENIYYKWQNGKLFENPLASKQSLFDWEKKKKTACLQESRALF